MIEIKKLGLLITDKVTGLKGMLIIVSIDMSNNRLYCFQPAALNPKTKEPLDPFWVDESRIIGSEKLNIDIPINVLGTQVQDIATKFKGTATQLYYYLNGCIHFEVKPKGIIKETGEAIRAIDFDLRRLKGSIIKQLSDEELKISRKTKPSPEFKPSFNKR